MNREDTIAAIATAGGEAGIGIIRISGPGALSAGSFVFSPAKQTKAGLRPNRLYYGTIKNPDTLEVIDTGYMVFFKGPASYTGEDTVELYLHGGQLILKKTLSLVLRFRTRLAGPGEFTKRAFLNGKLDLIQAEAVSDLIRAKTEKAYASAMGRLEGRLGRRINSIKEKLLDLAARIEAELDFSEDEIEGLLEPEFLAALKKAETELRSLLASYEEGRVLKEGLKVLILGRPNAGKSSLLNVLLKEERAIVTHVPGTTRDVIEEILSIKGIPVRLMDTAGLRDTEDIVESIGIKRTKERAAAADLILYVIDASAKGYAEDLSLIRSFEEDGKKIIVVANKSDLLNPGGAERPIPAFERRTVVFVSALKETGIDALEGEISGSFSKTGLEERDPGELITSIREKESLEEALKSIVRAMDARLMPREFAASDLRQSITRLGEITGEVTTEDILEKIFSTFCIGK
ncbi:MAG: tRNA uridine-5-carboxymethylaminomethyl(34) synthesis GTPase MnmE [Thermodesulfobacteriota bacterium]